MNPLLLLFKALSDETRLRLFNLLVDHELNVNEIVKVMQMGQSRISRHLKILNDCGLLNSRRDGLWTFYKVSQNDDRYGLVSSIVQYLHNDDFFTHDLKTLQKELEEFQKEKVHYFDSIAPKLDVVKYDIIGEDVISKQIVSSMKKCKVVADIGCGTGDLIPFLQKRSDLVIGIDRSMRMLDIAREQYKADNRQVDLRIGEIEYLPMKNNEADCVIINMVFHYLPAPQTGIKECSRVLRPGGQLIIVDLEKHSDEDLRSKYGHRWLGFVPGEIESWLNNENFSIEEVNIIPAKNGLKIVFVSAIYKKPDRSGTRH